MLQGSILGYSLPLICCKNSLVDTNAFSSLKHVEVEKDSDNSLIYYSMVVIYPDGDYGENILLGHTKRPGWI